MRRGSTCADGTHPLLAFPARRGPRGCWGLRAAVTAGRMALVRHSVSRRCVPTRARTTYRTAVTVARGPDAAAAAADAAAAGPVPPGGRRRAVLGPAHSTNADAPAAPGPSSRPADRYRRRAEYITPFRSRRNVFDCLTHVHYSPPAVTTCAV